MLRTVKSASGVVARWSFDCGYGSGLCCVGSSGLVGYIEMEQMERVGPRVLIPESFPAAQQFLEMRLLGTFPNSTVFAVLYAYIEATFVLHSQKALDRLVAFLWEMTRNVPYFEMVIQGLQSDFARYQAPSLLHKPQEISYVCNVLVTNLQLSPVNDYGALNACIALSSRLNIKGTLFLMHHEITQCDFKSGTRLGEGENCEFEIYLCGGKGKIYELYTTLTSDSFLHLTCGHLMLKYDLLASVAAYAGNFSFNIAWVASLNLQCVTCTRVLQPAEISEIYTQPNSAPRALTVRQGCCAMCGSYCEEKCAQCPRLLCSNCAVVACCTTGKPVCLACGADFFEALQGKQLVQSYLRWLQRILTIATREYSKQRQNEPTPIQPLQFASDPAAPKIEKQCQRCRGQIQKKSGLCSNTCCCLICEFQYLFAEKTCKALCQVCHCPLRVQYMKCKCSYCKQPLCYSDVFYICGVCDVCACYNCARTMRREDLLRCLPTKKAHWISQTKLKTLADNEKESCILY